MKHRIALALSCLFVSCDDQSSHTGNPGAISDRQDALIKQAAASRRIADAADEARERFGKMRDEALAKAAKLREHSNQELWKLRRELQGLPPGGRLEETKLKIADVEHQILQADVDYETAWDVYKTRVATAIAAAREREANDLPVNLPP